MLNEAALLALAKADEVAVRADITASSRASLTFLAKSALAADTLSVEAKVALFALLALETIVTLFAIDVDIVGTELAEAILNE